MSNRQVLCNKGCGQQIGFAKLTSGKWKPINLDGSNHDCQKKFGKKEDRSSYAGITEITEVAGADRVEVVNGYLAQGWSIIKTVTVEGEQPIVYVLGRRA